MDHEDDRLIENLTPCEKLCFMLLDQQRRLEDKLDAMKAQQDHSERWMIYFAYVTNCWKEKYQYEHQLQRTIAMILEKLSPEREDYIMQECLRPLGIKIANDWGTIYYKRKNATYKTIDYTRLREVVGDCTTYDKLINHPHFYDLPRRMWSLLTMEEVRQYLPCIHST